MPEYNDDFYYGYKPKSEQGEKKQSAEDRKIAEDIDRDISSYSKAAVPEFQTGRTARTAPARRSASSARRTSGTKSTAARNAVKKEGKQIVAVIDSYGQFCFKHLGNIIKIIAFIIAFGLVIAALILGFTIFKAKTGLSLLSLLIIIGGVIFAAILFFPIYGIGHVICQNNEILRIFNEEK